MFGREGAGRHFVPMGAATGSWLGSTAISSRIVRVGCGNGRAIGFKISYHVDVQVGTEEAINEPIVLLGS
jgi:hypothetical protein